MKKYENITLSFPQDLNAMLHTKVPRRGISKFVAEAVRKALKEDEKNAMLKLEAAYEEAEKDKERMEVLDDWKHVDLEDQTENWEWKS